MELRLSAKADAWVYGSGSASGGASSSSSDSSSQASSVTEQDQFTIGTTLPSGKNLQEKLDSWASNDTKIMSHPMPIGGMQLELLPQSILRSKKDRGTLTDDITKKMVAMLAHINEDRYC